MKPLIVAGKYQLDLRLGGGRFGEVYQGHDLETSKEVALKLERYGDVDRSLLRNEVQIYKELDGNSGIPQVYWHGSECEYNVMAFELLGPSLEDLFNYCSRNFSLKTVLLLVDQLICRFQYIHSKGYIHRDVKPDNLLMGVATKGNTVYITDIGLAQEFYIPKWDENSVVGTLRYGTQRYASINAHLGRRQSPRDDMESLGYVLLYFLKGSLPWQGLDCEEKEKKKMILKEKQRAVEPQTKQRQAVIRSLFHGVPVEFKKYFELVRSSEELDYGRLRRLFRGLFYRQRFQYDNVFDWTISMFLEKLEAEGQNSEGEQNTLEAE